MTTEILDPEKEWKMNPEMMEVVNSYLITTDARLTAQDLGIPREKVIYYLNKPEAKRFVDTIYLEQGYLNRHRLQDILGEVMELKLEEMRDSEIGTKKDILDVLALAHKIRADEAKINSTGNEGGPRNQTNVQINSAGFGDNYNSLLDKIMSVEK
jgi:hypothetical protein